MKTMSKDSAAKPGRSGRSPMRLRQIMVAVDFSAGSEKALRYGVALGAKFGATLTLLHVAQPYLPVGDMALDLAKMQMDSEKAAGERLELLRRGVPCKCVGVLRVGAPAHEIVKVAKAIEADLIIVGTHGWNGLARALMGSVAERVVRLAGCPVLAVRDQERDFVGGAPNHSQGRRAPTAAEETA